MKMAEFDGGPIFLLLFLLQFSHGFDVYWNIRSFRCKKHGFNFNVTKYNIKQNAEDSQFGNVMNILDYPGEFPFINDNGDYKYGGLPQNGNITRHLEAVVHDVKRLIPENSTGPAVIDQEHWRPLFYQNWARHDRYRKASKKQIRKKHPEWSNTQIKKAAEVEFNKAAKKYMEETLRVCKEVRPRAKWGYYHFPYCFNNRPPSKFCSPRTREANDRIPWLFDGSDALYPCIYINSGMSEKGRMIHVYGRIAEARRIAANSTRALSIYPYTRIRLRPSEQLFSMADLENTIGLAKEMGADGIIIWERGKNVNDRDVCQELMDYTTNILGPFIKQLTEN